MKNEWIINDNPIEPSDRIKNMSDEELEEEFHRIFEDYIESLPTKVKAS